MINTNLTDEKKPFLPAFGRAALILAGFSLVSLVCGGVLADSLGKSLDEVGGDERSAATQVLSVRMVVFAVGWLSALGGFLLGLLSLLGRGKVDGTSRPGAGFVGMCLGGLLAASPLLLIPAISAARNAAAKAEAKRLEQAKPAGPSEVTCLNGSIVVKRPGDDWQLGTATEAAQINSEAIAAAIKRLSATSSATAIIIAEPVDLADLQVNNDDEIQTTLTEFASNWAQAQPWTDKQIDETVHSTGATPPFVEVSLLVNDQTEGNLRIRNRAVLWQGHVVSMIGFVKASDANGSIFDRYRLGCRCVQVTMRSLP